MLKRCIERVDIGGGYSLVVPQKLVEPSGTPDFYNLIERIREVIDGERNVKGKQYMPLLSGKDSKKKNNSIS